MLKWKIVQFFDSQCTIIIIIIIIIIITVYDRM